MTLKSGLRGVIDAMPASLRDTLLRAYHAARILSTGVANRLPGACRVRSHGARNSLTRSSTGRLRKSTVTVIGNDNSIDLFGSGSIRDCRIRIEGDGNRVTLAGTHSVGLGVVILGNDNTVTINEGCVIHGLGVVCEDDANEVSIGASTEVAGATELAAMEGTRIIIGERCLFSSGIHIRTGDSHSVVDLEGRRINPSQDIRIGNHVWVGMGVTLLKGSMIADSSVIAAKAVVTKQFTSANCVIAGNPARVVREGVDWRVERIPI